MGSKSTPKAPDLTSLSNAQLQISQEQLAQAQQQMQMSNSQFNSFMQLNQQQLQQSQDQYNQQMALQQKALDQADAANAVSKSVADTQIASMNQSMQYAQQDRDRYENTFVPLQDQYIQAAQSYNTPQKQEQMASQALAENQNQIEAQRGNLQAQLASMGVDPSQVMSTSLSTQLGVGGAAQGAMAANQARENVVQTGYNMLANAVNMGNNLPAQQVANTNAATSSGNSAAGNINSSVANYNSASGIGQTASGIRQSSLNLASTLTGSPMSWAQLGNQSYGGASNGIMNSSSIQNQMFQNQMSVQNMKNQESQQFMNNVGTVASIAGMAMMAEGGSVGDAMSQPIMSSADWADLGGYHDGAPAMGDPQVTDIAPQVTAIGHAALSGMSPSQQWGQALFKAGQQLSNSGGKEQADPNLQKSWLKPVYRAEGGAMGGSRSQGAPSAGAQPPRPSQVWRGAMPAMQARDRYPAMLSHDEYVVPGDVVRQLGVNHFDKLVDKYHRPGA
jgi:hypothetical protein